MILKSLPFLGSSTKESTDLTTTVLPNGLHKPDNVPAYQGLLPGWSATPSGQGRHLQMALENTIAAFKPGGSLSVGCGDHLAPASSSQPHRHPQLDWSPQGAQVHAVPNLPVAASQRNRGGRGGEKENRSARLRGELMISRNRISESHPQPRSD